MAEEELEAVLNGTGWDVGGGLWGGTEPQSPVRLGSGVCYVVLAVIFNAEGSILLVQESKPCCRGLWYLPAGRVDPNENLVGALLREVREESGLRCEPVSLLAVEERGHAWVRFVFMARPTGGSLKTLDSSDSDSLQAVWFHGDPRSLPLRSPDILPLIDLGSRYLRAPPHPPTLPQLLPSPHLYLRLLIAFPCGGGRGLGTPFGFCSAPPPPPPPGGPVGRPPPKSRRSLRSYVLQLLWGWMGGDGDPPEVQMGLLGLQHRAEGPGGGDGICFNVFVGFEPPRDAPEPPRYGNLRGDGGGWRGGAEGAHPAQDAGGGTVPIRS